MSATDSLDEVKMGKTDVPVETLLLRRWSPRAFTPDPVSDGDLASIFTAAAWAASSYNEQPWKFVVGRKGDSTWQIIFDALLPFNQSWAVAAPVLYASFAKKTFTMTGEPNGVTLHDVGAASANASLQATALGFHTHGLAGFSAEKLRSSLAVPDDFDPVACWALGRSGDPRVLAENYKAMELAPRTRKPLNEFVYGAWQVPALP
jgi:nitroreductase